MSKRKKSKIFLSYAHEDIGMAKRIYQDLINFGLNIWFDTESLEVGQLWENAILDAIEESDYFIAFLSSNSITKKGYVQKELKTALNVVDLLPEDKIYILPVRIDNCSVKNRQLKKHHCINIFPESEYQNGLQRILQVVSPRTFIVRHEPKELSSANVNEMLKLHGYYDRDRNPEGRGIEHQYLFKEIVGDNVVIDKTTNLMWQQGGSEYFVKYEDSKTALDVLKNNGFAGFNDWHFPTLEEAMSLMDSEKSNGLYHINPLFERHQNRIWTSDLFKGCSWPWIVFFDLGYCYGQNFYDYNYIRAVRSIK
ncbi:MAG: TIR domain-containing protein [Candidatus Lokiarchaeota archaeon]|nr:TIR domain-containing protein [Candidatus Lokiarchaeota archaeon]